MKNQGQGDQTRAKEEAITYHIDIVLEVGRKALILNFSRNWEGLHTVRIL